MRQKNTAYERIRMMRTKKKIVYTLLAVCFLWIARPEAVSAAGSIKVQGTDIFLAQDYTVACGSGTAKYEPATKTLTLNQASIGTVGGSPLSQGIEIYEQGVTVELAGQNVVEAHIGIYSSSHVSIKGTGGGSLAVRVSRDTGLGTLPCCGIRVDYGGLDVQDADLQVTVSDLGTNPVSGYGLYIAGGNNLISNSRVQISMPSNTGSEILYTGINAASADSLTISDNSSITMDSVDGGIAVTGTLTVSGSRLSIPTAGKYVISSGNLEILNGSDVTAFANSGLALQSDNDITISNSTVNVESKGTNGILCQNLAVTDFSKLTAKGYWPAFFVVHDSVIRDSSVEAESSADVGMFCKEGNMEITGSQVKAASKKADMGGILLNGGSLTMTNSNVISPGGSGVSGIRVKGDISVIGGTTEIGEGNISSDGQIKIGGIVTAGGVPSYKNIGGGASPGVIFSDADYSAVDAATAKAGALKRTDYENFDAVEAAVNAVVRGKDIREQDIVDGYATAIEAAIAALKPVEKPDDPAEKPDDPAGKPDDPAGKPDDPAGKPDGSEEKPDDPSDVTGQAPSQTPPQTEVQKPLQTQQQDQGNGDNSPKTGDNIPVGQIVVFLVISAAGIAAGKRLRQ